MRIIGAGSAFPGNIYEQQEITSALKEAWHSQLDNPEVLDRLHSPLWRGAAASCPSAGSL